jgi:hypothetical protein
MAYGTAAPSRGAPYTAPSVEAEIEQLPPTPKPARRRRTDAERLADMQADLAKLKAAAEAKALAASAEPALPTPARTRTTPGRPQQKRAAPSVRRDEDDLDSELRDLVEGFVAALRDVIRRELVAQAKRRLS